MVTFVLATGRLSDCTGRLFKDRNGIKNAALIVMFTEWRGPLPSVGVASDRPIHSFAAESNHWNELSCGDHASASTRCLIALLSRPTPSVCLAVRLSGASQTYFHSLRRSLNVTGEPPQRATRDKTSACMTYVARCCRVVSPLRRRRRL